MIVCCEDDLEKSQLRDRFAKAGLSQKPSNYKFLNELREAFSIYIKRSNIILVNYIVNGMSPIPLAKSIKIHLNHQALIEADDDMLKASFGELRKKVGSYFRKWFKKPPKPKTKVEVIYDPNRTDLEPEEWDNIDDIVFYYLQDEQNPAATEMLMEAYRAGMQTGEMTQTGDSHSDVSDMNFSQMKDWQESHDIAERMQAGGLAQDWAYAATWAKFRASEHLAIYEDGIRQGHAYEVITDMFRDQITEGLANEEDISQIRSRLIFPETWRDVEGHTQKLSEALTPKQLKDYTIAHLNRDWDRFAFNEVQYAFNQGKLVRWSKFDVAYVEFTRVRGKGKSCPFCESHRGTICRLFPSEEAFRNSEFYGGGDTVVGDEMAEVAVWPGKSNANRSLADWWICSPAHPWCFSSDTEVLTNDGWKFFPKVLKKDKIFSLNPETKYIEYVPFLKKIGYNHKGQMIHFKARGYDSLVTMNHRIPIEYRLRKRGQPQTIKYKMAVAEELLDNKEFSIPRTGIWNNGLKTNRTDQLKAAIIAWYLSEGSKTTGGGHGVIIHQYDKKNKEEIAKIIEELGFKCSDHKNGIYINASSLSRWIIDECPGKSHTKRIPDFVKNMDVKGINSFLEAYVSGDGHARSRDCFGYSSEEIVYHTSSPIMMADLCELVLKTGKSVHTSSSGTGGKFQKFRNGIYKINRDVYTIRESKSNRVLFCPQNASSMEIVDYDNRVYCLELERNHVMLIRRNGVVCWSGNCNDDYVLVG